MPADAAIFFARGRATQAVYLFASYGDLYEVRELRLRGELRLRSRSFLRAVVTAQRVLAPAYLQLSCGVHAGCKNCGTANKACTSCEGGCSCGAQHPCALWSVTQWHMLWSVTQWHMHSCALMS